ncbi:Protein phosphatase 2C family protein [Raphanus sativus]|nr:Protein phosphatase 2C family protein [Raphanus sativus]
MGKFCYDDLSFCKLKEEVMKGLIKYGFSLVKGKANHPMEDYHVANLINIQNHDSHMGDTVPACLQKHLFSNILKECTDHVIDDVSGRVLGGSTKVYSKGLTRTQTRPFFRIVLTWDMAALLYGCHSYIDQREEAVL